MRLRTAAGLMQILCAAALAGCGTVPTPEPITKTVEVNVAVPIACVPSDLKRETFTDTDAALKAAPDFSVRYQLLAAEHARHFAFEDEVWAVIDACGKVPAPPPPSIQVPK